MGKGRVFSGVKCAQLTPLGTAPTQQETAIPVKQVRGGRAEVSGISPRRMLESSPVSASLTRPMSSLPREAVVKARPAWLRCLWLCLPALVIGAALRFTVMHAMPEAYYGSDSNSYFQTTAELWTKGEFELKSKRRWIYPLLLVPTPALPGQTLQIVAVAQHALGLATVFGIGWIVFNLTRRPQIWVPLVTTLAACWPRMLWHEHEMIAEALLLFTVVLSVGLTLPEGSLRKNDRLFWFLVATTAIVAVKPHGRPIWMGLLLAAMLIAGWPWFWSKKNIVAAAASVLIMLSSGSSEQGAWLLLSSALPVVRTEGAKYPEYRAALKPYIEEARADLSQYPWKQGRYKKMLVESKGDKRLGPTWSKLRENRAEFSKVAKSLAWDGILHSPVQYSYLVLRKMCMVLSDDNAGDRLIPKDFWHEQEANNAGRWIERPKELELLYEVNQDGYRALVAERQERKAWYEPYLLNFTKTFVWTRTIEGDNSYRTLHPAWFGMLALLGLASCLRPSRWRVTAPLWLSLIIYMGIIFAVGDTVARYLLPVDWIGMVFVVLGLDWILGLLWRPKPQAAEARPDVPAAADSAVA